MITVLIATYNGAKTLPAVLEAYRKLDPPGEEWTLVVIDNGSNDNTREVLTNFLPCLPLIILFEPRRGKNVALNKGLSHIAEGLTVFSDDDAIPHPNWLKELKLAADSQLQYAIFGGPIVPKWESPPDDWILSWVPLDATFAILNVQDEGPVVNTKIFGPNMAIRSDVFQMGYRFNERIGPKGAKYAQGSESELLIRLQKAGFKAWHCTNAVVEHMIRSHQMEKKWILARAIRFGRGQYRLGMDYYRWKAYFWGIPNRLFLHILGRIYRQVKAKLSNDEENYFKECWYRNYLFGIALEARLIYKERRGEAGYIA